MVAGSPSCSAQVDRPHLRCGDESAEFPCFSGGGKVVGGRPARTMTELEAPAVGHLGYFCVGRLGGVNCPGYFRGLAATASGEVISAKLTDIDVRTSITVGTRDPSASCSAGASSDGSVTRTPLQPIARAIAA